MAEIQKHFELSVKLQFDIDSTIVKDLNGLNILLTTKYKQHKEIKLINKLDKVLKKMQKQGWTVSIYDFNVQQNGGK